MTENHPLQTLARISEVINRDLAWAQAHLDLDLIAIADIASEEYKQRQEDGTFTGKAELLASYKSGNRHWDVADSTDHHVHIINDLAIIIGKWYGVGTNTGERFDYRARFLSIYRLENESWRMILDQSLPE